MAQRKLSSDDRIIWETVTESTKPLKKVVTRSNEVRASERNVSPKSVQAGPKKKIYSPISTFIDTTPSERNSNLLMDQKAFFKMTRGRMEPNAKIDLHGYTLADAFPALSQFIEKNYNNGQRLVLVITGKGTGKKVLPDEKLGLGVLRNQVPKWLVSPSFRKMILQVHQAHPKHGGSGAIYAYLRRRKKL